MSDAANASVGALPAPPAETLPDNPAAAGAEIARLTGDPDSGYWDRGHPGHDAAVARVRQLQPIKDGTAGAPPATRDAAAAELQRLKSDPSYGYWDSGHPNHRAAVERAGQLHAALVEAPKPASDAPADPSAYSTGKLILPEGLREPEHVKANLETIGWAQGEAHKAGLTVGEWNVMVEAYNDLATSGRMQDDQAINATGRRSLAELRERWGARFDERVARARAAGRQLGPRVVDYLEETGLGHDARVIAALADLAERRGWK